MTKPQSTQSADRAVNTTVEYALTFTVALVLSLGVSGFLVSANTSVNEDVAEAELDRIANKIAAAAESAEYQYNQTEDLTTTTGISADPQATVYVDLPFTILDTPYTIRIDGNAIAVEASQFSGGDDPVQTVTPTVNASLTAQGGTAGGPVKVYVDPADEDIVITSNPASAARVDT